MPQLAVGSTQILSGTCKYVNGNNATYYQIQLLVRLDSQDIINNTSTLTLTLQARSISATYYTYGYNQTSIIQGTTLAAASFDTRDENVWQTFGTRTITVSHSSDGKYTLSASASFTTTASGSTYALKSGTVSGSVELLDIPRASTIVTFDDFEIGANMPVVLTRYSGTYTDDLTLKINGVSVLTRSSVNTSSTITPTDAEREAMIVAAQNNLILAQLIVTTKNGGTTVGTRSKMVGATLKAGFTPYEPPKIVSFDCRRCLVDGTEDVFGTYVKFILNLSASSLIYDSGDAETNFLKYQIKYKLRAGSTWTERTLVTVTGLAFDGNEVVSGFPTADSYDVQIFAVDAYASIPVVDTIPIGKSILWGNVEGDGFGAGKKGSDSYNVDASTKGINSDGGYFVAGVDLIESGSNANGSFTKFADGMMICSHTLITSNSANTTWTFPAEFYALTSVHITAESAPIQVLSGQVYTRSATACVLNVLNASAARAKCVAHVTAFGRWKA